MRGTARILLTSQSVTAFRSARMNRRCLRLPHCSRRIARCCGAGRVLARPAPPPEPVRRSTTTVIAPRRPAAPTNTPARSGPGSSRGSAFASAARWSSGRSTSATRSRRAGARPTRPARPAPRRGRRPRRGRERRGQPAAGRGRLQALQATCRTRASSAAPSSSGARPRSRSRRRSSAQARAQSGVQGNQAGYAALTADAGGVITGVDVEPGMVVAAGAPVLRLAHDGPRDVVFSVPEDKVALVKAVAARQGRVERASLEHGATRCRRRSARSPRRPIRPRAPSSSRPTSALRRPRRARPDGDGGDRRAADRGRRPGAAVGAEGGAGQAASSGWSTGDDDDGGAAGEDRRRRRQRAVVIAGLAPGDRVVTAGVHVLSAGQKVRLYTDPEAPLGSASAPARLGRAAAAALPPPAARRSPPPRA